MVGLNTNYCYTSWGVTDTAQSVQVRAKPFCAHEASSLHNQEQYCCANKCMQHDSLLPLLHM